MLTFLRSDTFHILAKIVIGSVWVFHGLYSKLLNGIPRHRMIVAKILGPAHAATLTRAIGLLECLLGVWALSGWQPVLCAITLTAAIVSMNFLEIRLTRELLISAPGMVALNLGFIAMIWCWALR